MIEFDHFRTDREIEDLAPGETAYTVGWCFSIDEDQNWWVRGDYGCSSEPGGTVKVRLSRRKDHVEVDSSSINVRYISAGKPRDEWYPILVKWE